MLGVGASSMAFEARLCADLSSIETSVAHVIYNACVPTSLKGTTGERWSGQSYKLRLGGHEFVNTVQKWFDIYGQDTSDEANLHHRNFSEV